MDLRETMLQKSRKTLLMTTTMTLMTTLKEDPVMGARTTSTLHAVFVPGLDTNANIEHDSWSLSMSSSPIYRGQVIKDALTMQ